MSDGEKIRKLFLSRHACLRVVTMEEHEALDAVRDAAGVLRLPVHVWSAVDGIVNSEVEGDAAVEGSANAAAALVWWRRNVRADKPAVCVMLDVGDQLDSPHADPPRVVRAIRELVEHFRAINATPRHSGVGEGMTTGLRGCLVLIDHRAAGPMVLSSISTPVEMSPPSDDELGEIFVSTLRRLHREKPIEVKLTKGQHTAVVKNLRGLTRRQAAQIVADVVTSDGAFTADDIHDILSRKRKLLASEGVLEFVETPNSLESIGGLNRLKSWLVQRERAFAPEAAEYGLTSPRGVLLLGVQGAGKSLCAKAVAAAWKRPLFRMDPGALYDRYVGESERRLRDTLRQAETMAPVILWIDEIEKAFASAASQSTDGGLSKRMFGTLLTWMQEHRSQVFLIATANDIEALPPELLRKGRFDEIFFVDLPGPDARREIFSIHLKKRNRDAAKFDMVPLVAASQGYSGSEIEQAIVAGLTAAFAESKPLDTARLIECLRGSPPLSVTMAEKIAELRAWAKGRCVPADDAEDPSPSLADDIDEVGASTEE